MGEARLRRRAHLCARPSRGLLLVAVAALFAACTTFDFDSEAIAPTPEETDLAEDIVDEEVVELCGAEVCSEEASCCAATCVELSSAVEHCGGCGLACDATKGEPSCVASSCVIQCDEGFGDCDDDPATGCEESLVDNPSHCGVCGVACGDGESCVGEVCLSDDRIVGVVTGRAHSCALRARGELLCWGGNASGQLGDSTQEPRMVPTVVSSSEVFTHVALGEAHSCAINADERLFCWGSNASGQLGDDSTEDRLEPVEVPGLSSVVDVGCGAAHTCAVLRSGQVWCWGDGSDGRLGDGTGSSSSVPLGLSGITDAVEIALGSAFTCARREGGGVSCWGRNNRGQLGTGDKTASDVPVDVLDLGDAVDLSAGFEHVCAARSDGSAVCWGNNADGQIGDGTSVAEVLSISIVGGESPLAGVIQVGAGLDHSCARTEGGDVHCFGRNNNGQLGDDGGGDSLSPVPVSSLSGIAHLSVHLGEHSCALGDDRRVRCWGRNGDGQIGDGTTGEATTPVTLESLP